MFVRELKQKIGPKDWSKKLYFINTYSIYVLPLSLFQYIIPISVILVTHTQIIGIVRQRTQAATSFRHSNRADVTIRKSRKTKQILLIITLMFLSHLYLIFLSLFQYIIPISVILVTHTQIIGIVRQRTQAATSFRHSNRADVTIRKSRKTTQILLIIALMFGAHWLPYHIYTIGECFSSIYIY